MNQDRGSNSIYDPAWTANYFDNYGRREWKRMVDSPVNEVSLYIHTHYLEEYVSKGDRVLEIGAGAGRFTQILAGLGAHITVGDISPVQLELNKAHAKQFGFFQAIENWQLLDITDMSQLPADSFDCVVAYGAPLSYVLDKRDIALQECIRVLKPHGYFLLSVGSLWGSVHRQLAPVLNTPAENNRKIIKTGDISPNTYPERDHFLHLFRAAEFKNWLINANLQIKELSASSCLSLGWDEFLETIRSDETKWQELLRMELEASAEAGCLDMGTSIIAVTEK